MTLVSRHAPLDPLLRHRDCGGLELPMHPRRAGATSAFRMHARTCTRSRSSAATYVAELCKRAFSWARRATSRFRRRSSSWSPGSRAWPANTSPGIAPARSLSWRFHARSMSGPASARARSARRSPLRPAFLEPTDRFQLALCTDESPRCILHRAHDTSTPNTTRGPLGVRFFIGSSQHRI
jgi:hypothetical protein